MVGGSISRVSYSTHILYLILRKKRMFMNQSSEIIRNETFIYSEGYGNLLKRGDQK